mgnify:CR=1 FL=1
MTKIEKIRTMEIGKLAELIRDVQDLDLDGFCKSDCGDDECLNPIPCIVRWLEEAESDG